MKKALMVITIVVALSFLVSMIAVSPLFAAQATKTAPTTKQPTQQLKKDQIVAHTKFWNFYFDYVVVKGVTIKKGGGNKTIKVKARENVDFTLHYFVYTPHIKDIFESDAGAWGSGAVYYYNTIWIYDKATDQLVWEQKDLKYLPKFTWADVQLWQKTFPGTYIKQWTEQVTLKWTPAPQFIGHTLYIKVCCVNCMGDKDIPEFHKEDNGITNENILVTFNVIYTE